MKKRYHHGKLQEALIEATERIISSKGLEGVTLREVARAAHVSHTAPYHHFKDKEDLLAAVAERGFAQLTERMLAARGSTPRTRLLAICDAYVAFAIEQPSRFRAMFGPPLTKKKAYPRLKKAAEDSFAVLLEATRRASSKSRAMDLALAGWSLAHGLSYLSIEGLLDANASAGRRGLPVRLGRLISI